MTVRTMEYFTDGNLIINSLGGINFNLLEGNKKWEIHYTKGTLSLIHTKEGHVLLSFSLPEKLLDEVGDFFDRHRIPYDVYA